MDNVTASVKVMRSYDYCHFEIQLGTTEEVTLGEVNELRKEAMRLADNAVEQYKMARDNESRRANIQYEIERLAKDVETIRALPEHSWTPDQKAKVKFLADWEYNQRYYDYQDDWEERDVHLPF